MTGATGRFAAAQVDNRRGALMLVAAALFLTGEVVVVRLMEGAASDGQIVFARALVQLVVVTAWIAMRQPGLLRTRRPALHLLRGLTSLVCWWLYYRSFQTLDLALATVLTFTTSLFVVVLAGPILAERVGRLRWGMALLGFVGVVLAVLPGLLAADGNAAPLGIAAGLGSALAAAALIFQNRILSRTEPTATIMFYIALVATVATLPVLLMDRAPLELHLLALLILSGCLGTAGMMFTIEAYRAGEVSALAPFPYLRFVFSGIAGLLLFAEWPGPLTLAGAALIVLAAVIVTRRSAPPARKSGIR